MCLIITILLPGLYMWRPLYHIVGVVIVVSTVLAGCTNTAPDEIKAVALEQVVYDQSNYFGGCRAAYRDCKDTSITKSYEINLRDIPKPYQTADAAWCVQWSTRIRHPINNNYDLEEGWVIVFRQGTEYQPLSVPDGMLPEGNVICE